MAMVALALAGGCKPKPKEISSLKRKEGAYLMSEAQYAITMRDYAHAEGELTKAVEACPDNGSYWISLGTVRVRLGKKGDAKSAYKTGLAAYQDLAKLDPKDVSAVLQQVYVLALLGRADDARALLAKLPERFPASREVRGFVESKQFDRILADPAFKEISL